MHKEILKLSIPNILSNISVPLISTVDTALMGHLSSQHLGAVGIGAMIFNFIYWNFGFLRMGVTGMTAQAFGADDKQGQGLLFIRGIFFSVMIAIGLIVLMKPIESISLFAMNVQEGQVSLVSEYFKIRILAAPATLMIYVMMGWLLGMQNAVFPLVITVVVNGVNAMLSIYFVVYLGWDIAGVAWGTVIAQYTGLAIASVLCLWRYKTILQSWTAKAVLQMDQLKQFLSINADIFLRTIGLTVAFAYFYSKSSEAGETVLALNVILIQLLNWMSYGIDGFAFAAESMVGKYTGAKDGKKTCRSVQLAFSWGFVLALTYSVIFLIFFGPIIALFTSDAEILSTSLSYKWWVVGFPLVSFVCYIWDGVFIGLTAVKSMRNTMLASLVAYIIFYHIFKSIHPVLAIWLALVVFMIARGIFQTIWFAKHKLNLS